MSEIEEFRKIGGYDNYEVSNCGNVRNVKTGRVLKPGEDGDNYLMVCLSRNGKTQTLKIHKLVATAFLGDSEGRDVDHKDRNNQNNALDNLRYVSTSENCKNISGHGHKYKYIKEISPDAVIVENYAGHSLENIYYYDTTFYFFNGLEYRQLVPLKRNECASYFVRVKDTKGKNVNIYIAKYRREIGEIN
jgi:hypothetical protein